MSVSKAEPTVVVTCRDCGTSRTITVSWQRRLASEGRPAPCEMCKRTSETEPTDDDWWSWLEAHGVRRRAYERYGISAQEYVRRFGMPEPLQTLIDVIRP